jgi:hypothetical protein
LLLSDTATALRAALLAARNADGGWPYYRGKASRLEPTCAAFIALFSKNDQAPFDVLARWPRRDGLFIDGAGEINIAFNGLAAVTLAAQHAADARGAEAPPPQTASIAPQASPIARELAAALVRVKGVAVPKSTINRQDNSLQGWAWTVDTFSWVESTATCLLGLKRLVPGTRSAAAARRVHEAERLLVDRVCRDGGWNHGNSNMLGKELPAYIPTTALALLALHDRRTETDSAVGPSFSSGTAVSRSLAYLQRNRVTETGALALALSRICLGVYGIEAHDVEAAIAREWDRSAFIGNLHTTALALYALTGAKSNFEAFRV